MSAKVTGKPYTLQDPEDHSIPPPTPYNGRCYERIAANCSVSHCFAKVKGLYNLWYGQPYPALTCRQVTSKYCEVVMLLYGGAAMAGFSTLILLTPQDSSNSYALSPGMYVPICIIFDGIGTVSITEGIKRLVKTCKAPRVEGAQPLLPPD